MYEGYEISLTELGDYVWCPNKPVLALMKANEKIILNNEIVEQPYEETFPSVVLARRNIYMSLHYFEKLFHIDNYLYDEIIKELQFKTKSDYFTLYENDFSDVMDILREGMERTEWNRLTHLMGSVAESQFGKGTYEKTKLMTYYNGFIVINIPDAIFNNNTVYEFKTVQYTDYIEKQFRIAGLQADLTAYLFGYDYIYIDVMNFNDLKIRTVKRKANLREAEEILDYIFYNYENKTIDRSLISDQRCKNCKYKNICHK